MEDKKFVGTKKSNKAFSRVVEKLLTHKNLPFGDVQEISFVVGNNFDAQKKCPQYEFFVDEKGVKRVRVIWVPC